MSQFGSEIFSCSGAPMLIPSVNASALLVLKQTNLAASAQKASSSGDLLAIANGATAAAQTNAASTASPDNTLE